MIGTILIPGYSQPFAIRALLVLASLLAIACIGRPLSSSLAASIIDTFRDRLCERGGGPALWAAMEFRDRLPDRRADRVTDWRVQRIP